MSKTYSPKIVTDGLVMCLDPSQNKSYPTTDLPVKGGLALWLDAADDSTFSYSSGTSISQWRDKSGNDRHFFQSTAGNQPSRSAIVNSRKAIQFTAASSNYLRFNSRIINNTTAGSVFVVWRTAGETQAYSSILDNYHCGSNALGAGFQIERNVTNNQYYWGFQTSSCVQAGFIPATSYSNDTTNCIWITKDSTTITGGLNGTSGTPSASPSATWIEDDKGWTIGAWGAGTESFGRFFNGIHCEVLIFNRGLSPVEVRQVNTYLAQKWGVATTDRTITDLSGFNDNGLFGNGSTSNMPLYDYYNKSFKFYASNKYIKLGNNTNINQFAGDFTVSLWAMATAENSNYGNLIGDYYTAGVQTTNEWQIMMNNSSAFLNVYRHGTGYVINNTSSGFSANTWINVVLTRIGSAITLYANNTVIGTATNSSVFGSTTGNVNIGIDGNNSAEPFSGLISNILIYQKGLSAAEVARNYETQKSRFANTIVQQGLVLNLDAGNPYSYAGSGATWYDVSGNAFNATLIKTPTYSSDNGGVLNWNGLDQYATVPMSSTLRVTSITQEVWVYLSSTADQVFIGSQYGTGSNNSFALWISGGTFYFGVNTGGTFYQSSFSTPSVGVWYHLVHTYGGSSQSLYINGSLIGVYSSAASGNIAYDVNNTKLAIGADFNGAGYDAGPLLFVNGKMPVVRIYNIALSAAQVLQNYNATKGRYGL